MTTSDSAAFEELVTWLGSREGIDSYEDWSMGCLSDAEIEDIAAEFGLSPGMARSAFAQRELNEGYS